MNLNKIFDAFPPPKFLDTPFAGLYISDTAIRCIKFGRKGGILYIVKYTEKVIPAGVVTSGQINKREELLEMLSAIKKDLDLDFVRVSLPEEKAYLFTAKIPMVKPKEVYSAIESKIEENVPVVPSELIFDYNLGEQRHDGNLGVVVSALPITIIESYTSIVSDAGMSPLSLEIESQAIARALIKSDALGVVLIVHFRPGKVGLYVVNNRIVHFTSTIPLKTPVLDNPDFLLQEIKKLYTYWHTLKENVNKVERNIVQIIACGESFDEAVIPYLAAHNDTPVAFGNVWTNAFDVNSTVPEISFADSLRFSTPVGLALPMNILV